jgi:hypothetical protein
MNGSDPDGDIDKMYIPSEFINKFAELIIAECKQVSLNEIVKDSDIDSYSDPLLREYLKGNNGGVVDSIVAIQQHFFGVEE